MRVNKSDNLWPSIKTLGLRKKHSETVSVLCCEAIHQTLWRRQKAKQALLLAAGSARLCLALMRFFTSWSCYRVDRVDRVLMTAFVFVIPSYILIFPPSRASNEQHVRCEMKGYHSWSCYKAPSLCLCIFTCGLINSRCVWLLWQHQTSP